VLPVCEVKIVANGSKHLENVGNYAIANRVFNETAMGKTLASISFKGNIAKSHYVVGC